MADSQELKKHLASYITYGNNLRKPLSKLELEDLKQILDKLKAILSESEWQQQIGRRHDCFTAEVERILRIYSLGGNPYPETPITPPPSPIIKPDPIPVPDPDKPVVDPVKPTPDPVLKPEEESKPTPTPTPDNTTKPDPKPDPKPTPILPTPEELAAAQLAKDKQAEEAKYDQLLKDIKAETDTSALLDG